MRRISFLLLLSCIIVILVGCNSADYKSYEPKQFQYGKVVQIEAEVGYRLKIMDDKIYLVSPEYSLDDSKGQVEFREVNNSLNLSKSQFLELTNIESSTISLSSFSDNSNPSGALSVFNPHEEIGIVANSEKYIPISQSIKNEKGEYIETGTFSNDENVIMFYNQEDEKNTLTYWNKKGKMNKEILLNNIIEDKQISVDDMAVFHDDIYIYSYKSQKIYIISQNLELIDTLEIGDGLKNIPPEKWGSSVQFVLQRELGELFLYNSDKPEQGFYRISDT
ncbi:hypothetical protein, partial [Listeria seeligeri]